LAVGGFLVALSPLLPWVSVVLIGDVNLFDVAKLPLDGPIRVVLLPVVLLACGLAGILAAVVVPTGLAARVYALVLFMIALAVGGLLLAGLLQALSSAYGLAHFSMGIWVELAGR
jgi:hypothetical protein